MDSSKYYALLLGVDFPQIDFVRLAGSFGMPDFRVSQPGELKRILVDTLHMDGPILIEVVEMS